MTGPELIGLSIHVCPRFFKMKLEGACLFLIRSCKDVTQSFWEACALKLHGKPKGKKKEITLGGKELAES